MNKEEDVQLVPFFLNVSMLLGFISLSFLHFYFDGISFHVIQVLLCLLIALYWVLLRSNMLLVGSQKFWNNRFFVGAGVLYFGMLRFFVFDTPVGTYFILGLALFTVSLLFLVLIYKFKPPSQ